MEFEVVRPSALSPQDVASWRAMLHAGPGLETPFLDPGWALAVERAQGGADRGDSWSDPQRGVRAVVLRQDGQAKGFFSARVGRFAAMPAGSAMNDYQGVVCEAGTAFDPRDIVKALGAPRFDFTHMLAEQAHFQPFVRGADPAFLVEMRAGYAAYLDDRKAAGTNVLKDMDKRKRKAEREAGAVTTAGRSGRREDLETLIAWKRRQYRDGG
ncbi:MAG: cellulose biosynthesis protein CelD, partial [Caulobacteraceae bacterium]|nr:cellulose biosynthesis protein CelD [Caulobacteraceae bacterium]